MKYVTYIGIFITLLLLSSCKQQSKEVQSQPDTPKFVPTTILDTSINNLSIVLSRPDSETLALTMKGLISDNVKIQMNSGWDGDWGPGVIDMSDTFGDFHPLVLTRDSVFFLETNLGGGWPEWMLYFFKLTNGKLISLPCDDEVDKNILQGAYCTFFYDHDRNNILCFADKEVDSNANLINQPAMIFHVGKGSVNYIASLHLDFSYLDVDGPAAYERVLKKYRAFCKGSFPQQMSRVRFKH